jgi:hypothetical protein
MFPLGSLYHLHNQSLNCPILEDHRRDSRQILQDRPHDDIEARKCLPKGSPIGGMLAVIVQMAMLYKIGLADA